MSSQGREKEEPKRRSNSNNHTRDYTTQYFILQVKGKWEKTRATLILLIREMPRTARHKVERKPFTFGYKNGILFIKKVQKTF